MEARIVLKRTDKLFVLVQFDLTSSAARRRKNKPARGNNIICLYNEQLRWELWCALDTWKGACKR
jgi:hypothetical protein